MREFTLFGYEDGEMKACFSSTDGKWKCMCCGESLTIDSVAALLYENSENDGDCFEEKEVNYE